MQLCGNGSNKFDIIYCRNSLLQLTWTFRFVKNILPRTQIFVKFKNFLLELQQWTLKRLFSRFTQLEEWTGSEKQGINAEAFAGTEGFARKMREFFTIKVLNNRQRSRRFMNKRTRVSPMILFLSLSGNFQRYQTENFVFVNIFIPWIKFVFVHFFPLWERLIDSRSQVRTLYSSNSRSSQEQKRKGRRLAERLDAQRPSTTWSHSSTKESWVCWWHPICHRWDVFEPLLLKRSRREVRFWEKAKTPK